LIINGHDVCGLHVTVHEAFALNVCQGVQNGLEHLARFRWRERPVRKNLRQVLFGVLHDDVEQTHVTQVAAPHLEEPDQMRMRQSCGQPPSGELGFRVLSIRRNEFNRDFLKFPLTVLGKKHGAVVRATQVLAQAEFPIDDLAFPLFPGLGHTAPCLSAQRYCTRAPAPGFTEKERRGA
jgi:hypothetical protein